MIDTHYGIQVPALLHSLIETFSRDGISGEVFSDKDLMNWINKRLMQVTRNQDTISTQIGRGVGTHVDYTGERDQNRDPFIGLMPDKASM